MTRPVRMLGVVLVAALTVALPALGSAHGAVAAPATAGTALLCPGSPTTGGTGIKGHARSGAAAKAATMPARGHRRRHSHRRATPCFPPCRWLTAVPVGASGPTGPTVCVPPRVCPLAGARPQRICPPIWCGAEGVAAPGEPGDVSGPTGATLPCPPLPCPVPGPGAAIGATGATLICRPWPCPVAYGTPSGATTPAFVCPPPPVCPLSGAGHPSVCVPPCVVANRTATTNSVAVCPEVPRCPPPATAGSAARPLLYACPEAPATAPSNR